MVRIELNYDYAIVLHKNDRLSGQFAANFYRTSLGFFGRSVHDILSENISYTII